MHLKIHLPSHMTIAGNRVIVSYEEQPATCYGCNDTGHQYQDCPRRKRSVPREAVLSLSTWVDIVSQPAWATNMVESRPTALPLTATRMTVTHISANNPTLPQLPKQPDKCYDIHMQEAQLITGEDGQEGNGEARTEDQLLDTTDPPRVHR
jgi:hypothetical protein